MAHVNVLSQWSACSGQKPKKAVLSTLTEFLFESFECLDVLTKTSLSN